ncbi:MAG TPA: MFS transporter [Candidatus Fournierella merdigallinarum]|nr:MFS transporter [Candidatus Fournierella merdigallinarum]
MNEQTNTSGGLNRAKPYQLVLFPLNNGATNVYYVLILTYIATFGNVVLGLAMVFASFMVTGMRVFDAITDPIIGALMDRTNGKFGKFRPFMVIGCVTMALSVIALYVFTPYIPAEMMGLRYAAFSILYAVWVIGYTFQTSVTRAAQAVLTDDPKQRPLFTIFNTVGSLAGMGVMQFIGPILARDNIFGDYNQTWFAVMTPIGIAVSVVLTILAIIGIWEKDQPKYFGLGGAKKEKVKVSEYLAIIKANKPLQRLMVAGGGCKLALSIATNLTVLAMLYSCMMGNYDVLYLPMMVLGYVFAVPFFGLTVRTSQKHGQRASLMRYVGVALACYVVVLALLILWDPANPAFNLSLYTIGTDGSFQLTLNLYTILFILFFGVGYGAYYATADMPIPMVADCSDYETYRTGKFVPGIMGTLFSLVDKLVSSLSATVVGIAVSFIGLETLPTKATPYVEGMNVVVIVLFCVIPMIAWAATLFAMKGYALTGERMKEIRAVNAARKDAIAKGMSTEEAMKTWVTIDQVPAEFRG